MRSVFTEAWRAYLLPCTLLLVALWFLADVFAWLLSEKIGGEDWDVLLFHLAVPGKLLGQSLEMPLWNPYYAGGLPVLANPQSRFFSPSQLLAFVAGPVAGTKLAVLCYYAAGFAGCYALLARALRLRGPAVFAGTLVFCCSSFLPLHLFAGHFTFYSCMLLPWLALSIWQATRPRSRWSGPLAGGLILAVMYSEGSHMPLYILAGLGPGIAVYVLQKRSARPLLQCALALAVFSLLSMYRLLPQLEYLSAAGANSVRADTVLGLETIWQMFTLPTRNPYAIRFADQPYFWWEYGAYIGLLPPLLLVTLSAFIQKRDLPVLAIFFTSLLLIAGDFGSLSPAGLLIELPVYSNLRGFPRFALLTLASGAVLLALWSDRALRRAHSLRISAGFVTPVMLRRSVQALCLLLCAYLAYDLRHNNTRVFRATLTVELPDRVQLRSPGESDLRTIQALPEAAMPGASSRMLPALVADFSTRDAYEPLSVEKDAIRVFGQPGYTGEAWFEATAPDASTIASVSVEIERQSARRVVLSFATQRSGAVVWNQSRMTGWRAEAPYAIDEESALLRVPVEAGEHRIALSYDRPLFRGLLWLGLLAQLSLAGWLLFNWRRRPGQ